MFFDCYYYWYIFSTKFKLILTTCANLHVRQHARVLSNVAVIQQ